jgi:hypothetical protein
MASRINRARAAIAAAACCGLGAFALTACGSGGTESTVAPSATETVSSSATQLSNRGLPQGSESVNLDPADFTTKIDNPYWPMSVGSRWVFSETNTKGSQEKVVIEVTDKTKTMANGIEARVVRDTVTEHGVPVEVTDDWYAQDQDGNIWYLGEATTEYENGKPVSTEGSFEAGVDRAQPGVIMPAKPIVGTNYRQEYYVGHAEDRASIMSRKEQVEVPYGYFRPGRVLMTRDLNPLQPKILEYKFYARGIGPVLAVGVSGGSDREELVRYSG